MLDHVSITVSLFADAERFYDAVFAELGVPKVGREDGWAGYGLRADADHEGRSYISIIRREGAGREGPRHWAFRAARRLDGDAFWRAGLATGGTNDGAPGVRSACHSSYYAAFLRDPDGNRVEAVCHLPEGPSVRGRATSS
jgi:catechol 2,3-dioxygenase-like lactoylglutathione lyase family enzyme